MNCKGKRKPAPAKKRRSASSPAGEKFSHTLPTRKVELGLANEQLQSELSCCRRTEEILRESEAKCRSLIESAQDVIFVLADDGTITFLNAAFEQTTGWSRAEWIGRSYIDLIHSEDRSLAVRLLSLVQRGSALAPFELRIKTHSGEPRIGEFKVVRENRPPHLILGIARDITERKKIDEERARLEAAVQAAAEAVVVTDERGFIQYVNPAFEQVTGWARDESIGRTLHLLDSGKQDRAFFLDLREKLSRDGVWRGRLIQRKKDGSLYYEDSTCSPVINPEGRVINYVSVKRDVTSWLKLESIAESVNTVENVGYIVSGVRHEIGNPVNSAMTVLSVLRHKLGTFTVDKIRDYLDNALAELGRVEYLLKCLRNPNLNETPEIRNVDVAEFIKQFKSLVSEDFKRRNIAVTVDEGPKALTMSTDARALQQALLNVMTNAADAVAGREKPSISVTITEHDGKVHISATDNGCGMTEDQQKQLFKPFYTSKAHGTGLGLVLVKKIMTRLNGDILVTSTASRGTTVDLFVPKCTEVL